MRDGATFWDDDDVFARHQAGRHRADSPNESLEKPVITELIGGVTGLSVLDLGCGDGGFGRELLAAGCRSYVGLESSAKMAGLARDALAGNAGRVIHGKIEDWDYPPQSFDLVVSRLALHYVPDLDDACRKAHQTLVPGGRFVFSVVHPVISSCDRSRADGGQRQDWIVDDYFAPGPRSVYFFRQKVTQYHRTVEDHFAALRRAGFAVEALRESRPRRACFADEALYRRRGRIPLFLFLAGTKAAV